jgi:hypothetical protein
MGSMSASDAAPLPRLGEVYFDVRGESRSMRLSWYADTGVAVFSIWQGGTCTGTFRLPIADLPRMVQALQRGPDGAPGTPAEQPDAGQARRAAPAREPEAAMPGGDIDPRQGGTGGHRARAGRHHEDGRAPAGYSAEPEGDYPDATRAVAYGEELAAAHPAGGAPGGYDSDPGGGFSSGQPGGYSGDPGSGYGGDYSGSGGPAHRGAAYSDEPTGIYHDPELSDARYEADRAGGLAGSRYDQEPAGPYPDGSGPGGYRDHGPPSSGAGFRDDPLGGRYDRDRDDPLSGTYDRDDPLSANYDRDDPLSGTYDRDDSGSPGFGAEPTAPYPGGGRSAPQYDRDRTAYSHGGYEDEPTGLYRGEELSQDYPGGSYPDSRYAGGEYGSPHDPDYPAGPATGDYPAAGGPRDLTPLDPEYPAGRPYTGSRSRDDGPPVDGPSGGGPREPRRSRSRQDDESADESFPYRQPPIEHHERGRAR